MAEWQEHGPFRAMALKQFIPLKLQPWIFVLLALIFQTSNVVYPACLSAMKSGTSLLGEDIMMCLYAAFAGMNVAFPMMWRFKFTFTTKEILSICVSVMIVCNIIVPMTTFLPLLLFVCFLCGFAKMWATFECISTINPWLAPGLDFPKFFPLLYMMILCPIYLSSAIDVNLTHCFSWQAMHFSVVGVLILVLLFVRLFMQDFYLMGKGKLLGFDFTGLVLWGLLMMQMSFIAIYGEHYNWLSSEVIRFVIGTCLITAGLCFGRMYFIRHPYIKWDALAYKRVPVALFLFFLMDAIMETPNSLQGILTSQLLGFDALNLSKLQWWGFAGTFLGCLFSLWWLRYARLPIIRLAFFGFLCALLYQSAMYFGTSENLTLQYFYIPTLLRTFGYASLYCSLTYYMKEFIPFDHFLQVLAVAGVIRSGVGGSVGSALYGYGLRYTIAKNSFTNLGIDGVLAVSIKELWGITIIVCIFIFMIVLLFDTSARPVVKRLYKKIR
ncbi:MAG: hypothetical protein IJ748_01795 [Bacteroidales bacterium]|nr:hypothetical protein [Bacteroidales bacterium]